MYPIKRNLQMKHTIQQNKFTLKNGEEVEYLTFPLLEQCDIVSHLFSTRLGGVSEGIYASMNLSYSRGDVPEKVTENFARIAEIFGQSTGNIVCSDQTHTTNVRRVYQTDGGKGVTRQRDYHDVDALITNDENVILACFYADCVPIYFVDPRNRAIGLAHSGWRGTAGKISHQVIAAMETEFGSKREDILACIGPSICSDCYEVSEDVANVFLAEDFAGAKAVIPGNREGKFQLDLWKINLFLLREAGILEEHINVTDVCTCCNGDYLFSHRKSDGKRGNLGAFLMLRKS